MKPRTRLEGWVAMLPAATCGLFALAAMLAWAPAAIAQVSVQTEYPALRLARGATAPLTVLLANDSGTPIYLNGIGHGLPPELLPSDGLDPFASSRPAFLQVREVWTGVLANLAATPDAPIAEETYELTLIGGPDPESMDVIARTCFIVDVYDSACAPTIAAQPQPVTVVAGGTIALSVVAGNASGVQYQWRRDGTAVLDDEHATGSQSATLQYTGIAAADSGAYDVLLSNACGQVLSSPAFVRVAGTTGVSRPIVPPKLYLSHPSPNPSRQVVRLSWSQQTAGPARLEILDVSGRLVKTLVRGEQPAGQRDATWAGIDNSGGRVAPPLRPAGQPPARDRNHPPGDMTRWARPGKTTRRHQLHRATPRSSAHDARRQPPSGCPTCASILLSSNALRILAQLTDGFAIGAAR